MAGTSIPTKRGIPGVYKLENDLSLVLSPQSAVYCGMVIESEFGVVDQIKDITSETQLVKEFGEPNNDNFDAWFNIAQVFRYKIQGLGGVIRTVRVIGDGCSNDGFHASATKATSGVTSTVLIRNNHDVDVFQPTFTDDQVLQIFTKFPTTKKLKVAIGAQNNFESAEVVSGVKFIDNVEFEPTSPKQFYLFVLDEKDNILEKHLCSMDRKEKDPKTDLSLGVETQINERSDYIVAFSKDEADVPVSTIATELSGGVYNRPTQAQLNNGYRLFENVEDVELQYIMGSAKSYDAMSQLAITRDDCAFRSGCEVGDILGMDEDDAVTSLKTKYKTRPSTSRGSVVAQVKMIDDIYNGKKRWITCYGDAVGLRIKQNLSKEPWWSDGGYNYGIIQNAIRVAQAWKPESVRELIKARFNPIISANNVGYVKIEQHNFTSKNSALRDENVRELVNYIYRTSKVFLKYKLHEFNDEITRYDVYTKVRKFLENVQAGRGIRRKEDGSDGFVVICDSTNNTDEVINQNELIIDITFLPARAITEIYLRVNIAASGIQLEVK